MKDLILLGSGGHATACLDLAKSTGLFKVIGLLDDNRQGGETIGGVPVLGKVADVPDWVRDDFEFLIAFGQISSAHVRESAAKTLTRGRANLATVLSPHAYISAESSVGDGTAVFPGSVVGSGVRIGRNCIVNSGSIIEHGGLVSDNCHISTGAILNGGVSVGASTFVGSGAIIFQGLSLPRDCIVPAGFVVSERSLPELIGMQSKLRARVTD